MRRLPVTAVFVAATLVAGCASENDDRAGGSAAKVQATKGLPSECGLGQAEALLAGLIAAVSSGDESAAVRYVAPQPELYSLALYTGPGPGEGRIDAGTPAAVYEGMRVLARGEDFALAEATVGTAPRADKRSGPRVGDPIAGVDFTYESTQRSISGKVGYNCATGQVYTGAMTVRPG